MKRIFLGLTILLLQFMSNLPWDDLSYALGISRWDSDPSAFAALLPLIVSAIIVSVFLKTTRLRDRLNMPAAGMTMITIGILLSITLWVTVMGVLIAIISAVAPDTGAAIILTLVFANAFGTLIEVCSVTSSILLFIGFYRLFLTLEPNELDQEETAKEHMLKTW